jgi:hypothetical protein
MSQIAPTFNPTNTEENPPSLFLGLVAGFLAACVSAILWAVITKAASYQIGFMAIGVGILVGLAVRLAGRGRSPLFGIAGALLALLGCVAGNFLAVLVIGAEELDVTILELLQFFISRPVEIVNIMQETFQPVDLLFYGIALYEGYRFSIVAETKPVLQPPLQANP